MTDVYPTLLLLSKWPKKLRLLLGGYTGSLQIEKGCLCWAAFSQRKIGRNGKLPRT
jgi:hypothetical protein